MATAKAKKPSTKLRAGKKKLTNKWIIVGGIAAVVIVGAVIVRLSGAASTKWLSVGRIPAAVVLTSTPTSLGIGENRYSTIKQGNIYRTCLRAYSSGSVSKVSMTDINGSKITHSIGKEGLYCTNPATAGKNRISVTNLVKLSGKNVVIKAASIDQLVFY